MKKVYILLVFITAILHGQLDTAWTRTFGGNELENINDVIITDDDEYVIVGRTFSYGDGIDDVWLIKTNSNGDSLWTKCFGGSESDAGQSIQQTTDGGYIITGSTSSFGQPTPIGISSDVWLIKTDSNGTEEWNQTFGGSSNDGGSSVQQTTDGGYIITGYQYVVVDSIDFFINLWLIKTDSTGQEEWNQIFGGEMNDFGTSVKQTDDGGYIILGQTYSFGNGNSDIWLIKTNSSGIEEWNQTIGTDGWEIGYSLLCSSDGGYIIAGRVDQDVLLIKTDSSGNTEWNRTFGGDNNDYARCVTKTIDGGFIITGMYGPSETNSDIWLIKTNSSGIEEWNQTFESDEFDMGTVIESDENGAFIIGGYKQSDIFLMKVEALSIDDIPNTYIQEDSSFTTPLNATSAYISPISFSADSFHPLFTCEIIDSNFLRVTPEINWNGSALIIVTASNGFNHSDTTQFTLTVNSVNDSPQPFTGLQPTLLDTFSSHIDNNTDIEFIWEDCNDVDSDIYYKLTIELEFFGNTYADTYDDIIDTTISIPANNLDALLSGLNMDMGTLNWYVQVSDEEYTVISDTGQFVLSRSLLETIEKPVLPEIFTLHQNHPNPFNPVTTLRYDLPEDAMVNITIYDMMGRQVSTLVSSQQNAGYKSVRWNATNDKGAPVSAGLYLYTIQAGEFRQTKKMVLLK